MIKKSRLNRKFLYNNCEFTRIKEKYSNFNIKLITGLYDIGVESYFL